MSGCSHDVRQQVLARSPISRNLDAQQRLEFDQLLEAKSWSDGQLIALAGEKASGLFIVATGRVRLTRDTKAGKEVVIGIGVPGDIIGPLSAEPHPDSVWAFGQVCLLHLDFSQLAQATAYPAAALAMLQLQHAQLRDSQERSALQFERAESRVAAVLLMLAEKDSLDVLKEDIASLAGTTVETASRVLSKFKREGLIDSGRGWIKINSEQEISNLI